MRRNIVNRTRKRYNLHSYKLRLKAELVESLGNNDTDKLFKYLKKIQYKEPTFIAKLNIFLYNNSIDNTFIRRYLLFFMRDFTFSKYSVCETIKTSKDIISIIDLLFDGGMLKLPSFINRHLRQTPIKTFSSHKNNKYFSLLKSKLHLRIDETDIYDNPEKLVTTLYPNKFKSYNCGLKLIREIDRIRIKK